MKEFHDLEIFGDSEVIDEALHKIEESLNAPWEREAAAEERNSWSPFEMRNFAYRGSSTIPAAHLWLSQRAAGAWYVSNIVPDDPAGELNYDEYNAILQDFYTRFIEPLQRTFSIKSGLLSRDWSIEDLIEPGTAKILKTFSEFANRSTGAGHPSDRYLWNEFIAQSHRQQAKLTGYHLRRWLIEEERWPTDQVSELARSYELGRQLLSHYDERPGS